MKTYTFWTSLVIDDEESDVEVEYTSTPYVMQTRHSPAEGGEIILLSVNLDGDDIINSITDDQNAKIIADCEDRSEDDAIADADDEADYRYECYRDRQMEDG